MQNRPFGVWPPDFVCNVRNKSYHLSSAALVEEIKRDGTIVRVCECEKCVLEKLSWVMVGEPAATIYRSTEDLKTMGLVGVYCIRPQAYFSCGVCQKSLAVSDPAYIANVRSGRYHVVHYDCLSTEEKEKIGGMVPYVVKIIDRCDCGAELEKEKADERNRVSQHSEGGEVFRSGYSGDDRGAEQPSARDEASTGGDNGVENGE